MKFSLPRAGVFAPVVILFVSLFGAGTPVALAQDQAPLAYIAEEVVQPLPTEQSLEERVAQAPSLQELVGDIPVVEELSADMKCLAQAVYFEARGEPLAGQLAVARVVINRATSGLYPPDYCAVVTQRSQFSFVKGGRIPEADEGSEAWRRARAIAQIAHQDLWQSEARDALYFHASYVNPSWARRKTQLARIDTHIFYR
jgi:spore germination cell wall hydrolase CwlJ-like protein